jgi:hypothetical protein
MLVKKFRIKYAHSSGLYDVGRNVNMTPADKDFVRLALDTDMPVLFKQQAKALGSMSGERYRKYSQATTTLREAKRLGMSNADIYHDYSHGFIQFPANEPDLPGHVFELFAFNSFFVFEVRDVKIH